MLYYKVKVSIDKESEREWLNWMKSEHIVHVLQTGLFEYAEILKCDNEYDGKETYIIQYKLLDEENYNKYITEFSEKLREEHTTKYADKFIASREINRIIELIRF